jgi:3-hydroxyisobutyrate dehydrogenase-like beta-hydroxyacid dehydrogenase
MSEKSEHVGFIGLGAMGAPMAMNLIAAGILPTVWNRTEAKAAPLIAQGAKLASSPADAADPGGIVVSMLADDAAVEAVVIGDAGIGKRLGSGGIHLSMSTIGPATARRLARYHAEHGSIYVAAPVFGRPDNAAQRQLVVCTSGPQPAKVRVRPLLDAIGRAVFDFGEDPGAANVVKLCGNFLIASALEALGEALALSEKSGIERTKLAEMLGKTLFACPVYQRYGEAIAAHRYEPAGFKMPLGLKDVELVLETAGAVRTPMPLAALVRERLVSGLANGREELDWSALALGIQDDAGLR